MGHTANFHSKLPKKFDYKLQKKTNFEGRMALKAKKI
jgi:hypothetical protein